MVTLLAQREMETLIIEQKDRENVSLCISEQVRSEMEHAYLTRWIGLPNPELFQLKAAAAVLQTAGCSPEETKLVATVLLLIHHGLFVHEHIDECHQDEKIRQLKVLAGDYYSSKYFYLLAAGGKIDLIGSFAEAIVRINEAKAERVSLLRLANPGIDRYLAVNERIHGELLYALCSRYLREHPIVFDLVKLLIRAYVLGTEYREFMTGHYFGNLSQVYLGSQVTEEESRMIGSAALYGQETKVTAIHVKYGTSSFLYERFRTGLMTARSLVSVLDSGPAAESFDGVCRYLDEAYLETPRIVEER